MENQDYEKLELQTKAFVTDLLSGMDMEAGIDESIGYIIKEISIFTSARSVLMYKALYRTKETTRRGCTVFEEWRMKLPENKRETLRKRATLNFFTC